MTDKTKIELPAFYGVKAGMTRVFDEQGNHVPVTVIKLIPNVISQVKTTEKDGYEAYQVAYNQKRESLVKKPMKGHLSKASIEKAFFKANEVLVKGVDPENLGKEVSIDGFTPETYVDVTGVSKGKGFQGVVKKFGFSGGPMTHGSHFHRGTGSIGNRATPGKIFPGKKMPGHMGAQRKTIQNLKIYEVNPEKGYLLLKGSIPGSKNSFVQIAKSVKK